MQKPLEDSPPLKWIEIEDFEFICFNLAKELMEFSEPIPDYAKRDQSLLESALNSPKQAYYFKEALFSEQASIPFYSMIKNHPFENGNKRIAVMSLLVFLLLNKKWINIKPELLYRIAVLVAESKPSERDQVIEENGKLFEEFIIHNFKVPIEKA